MQSEECLVEVQLSVVDKIARILCFSSDLV